MLTDAKLARVSLADFWEDYLGTVLLPEATQAFIFDAHINYLNGFVAALQAMKGAVKAGDPIATLERRTELFRECREMLAALLKQHGEGEGYVNDALPV